MKPLIVLPGLLLALTPALSGARAQAPPADWIDPATGHRVLRLSGDGGGSSLYFHQNTYTPRGDRLIFDTPAAAEVSVAKMRTPRSRWSRTRFSAKILLDESPEAPAP